MEQRFIGKRTVSGLGDNCDSGELAIVYVDIGVRDDNIGGDMDFIELELGGTRTVAGLGAMLEAVLGPHGYTDSSLAEVPIALLIIEIAKRAEDRDDWFPLGKWATIQAIQDRCDEQLSILIAQRPRLPLK